LGFDGRQDSTDAIDGKPQSACQLRVLHAVENVFPIQPETVFGNTRSLPHGAEGPSVAEPRAPKSVTSLGSSIHVMPVASTCAPPPLKSD
jgi:hypothetical protein